MLEHLDGDPAAALALRALHRPKQGPVFADWTTADLRRRIAAGRRQPLARALGLHKLVAGDPPPRLLDATAGLGRDGFVMASLGAAVWLAERQPETAALLHDARRRALLEPGSAAAAERITVLQSDALAVLEHSPVQPWDAVYLDPMYPDDGKSALPSKEMQVLRELTGGDEDADVLLQPALRVARRVVVKRPSKAPWLAGIKPSVSIEATQLRFDLYLGTA